MPAKILPHSHWWKSFLLLACIGCPASSKDSPEKKIEKQEISHLLEGLQNKDFQVVSQSLQGISNRNKSFFTDLSAIAKTCSHSLPMIRYQCIRTLGKIGHKQPILVSVFLERLQDTHWNVQFASLQELLPLRELMQKNEKIKTAVLKIFQSPYWIVKKQTLDTIDALWPHSPEQTQLLVHAFLHERETYTRHRVLHYIRLRKITQKDAFRKRVQTFLRDRQSLSPKKDWKQRLIREQNLLLKSAQKKPNTKKF